MAESLLSTAGKKLAQVVGRELSLYACARRELGKLRETSESIQALLADAEGRQAEEESVRLWLSRVRGVAYDIDDVLDDWVMSGHESERDDDDDWVISDFVDWELQICGWKELKSLPPWLVQLKALKTLKIVDCIALSSLPLWLKGLPLLQELTIRNCPQLSEWYEKEGGNDLLKILQIPIIDFDDVCI